MSKTAGNITASYQRRKDDRPGQILEAASHVFAQKGFTDTRMQDVASKAKISIGTVYVYYKNKDELLKSVLRHFVDAQFDSLRALSPELGGSAESWMRITLSELSKVLIDREPGRIVWRVLSEGEKRPEMLEFFYKEILAHGLSLLRHIIEQGQQQGTFMEANADDVSQLVVSPMLTALIYKNAFSHKYAQMDVERFISFSTDFLLNNLKPKRRRAGKHHKVATR